MLAEAKRRNTTMPRQSASDLQLVPETERLREEPLARLHEMPYLKVALVGPGYEFTLEPTLIYRDPPASCRAPTSWESPTPDPIVRQLDIRLRKKGPRLDYDRARSCIGAWRPALSPLNVRPCCHLAFHL
jgi:hypothetical protein